MDEKYFEIVNELSDKRIYQISEVAKILGVEPSNIRYWEGEFSKYLRPARGKNRNRTFKKKDIMTLRIIQFLLKEKKFTLEGAKKHLKSYGIDEVGRIVEVVDKLKAIKFELEDIRNKIDELKFEE